MALATRFPINYLQQTVVSCCFPNFFLGNFKFEIMLALCRRSVTPWIQHLSLVAAKADWALELRLHFRNKVGEIRSK